MLANLFFNWPHWVHVDMIVHIDSARPHLIQRALASCPVMEIFAPLQICIPPICIFVLFVFFWYFCFLAQLCCLRLVTFESYLFKRCFCCEYRLMYNVVQCPADVAADVNLGAI